MMPRSLLRLLALLIGTSGCQPEPPPELIGYSATELAVRLAGGEFTSVEVTRAYLARIEALNRQGPTLNAVLEVNPRALDDARVLDETFLASGPVGILHGVPVVIKANIDVAGLVASAGSLALADHRPAQDAHLVARLRKAGAVVLATTNLSEWANFRDQNSSSGWSSLGGQARNPHVLDRNPCGSSSGSAIAVAARMAPLAVGTETHGSIVCPAGLNGVVGIKPSVGLVSRTGIIPISHTQDTAGPLARSVVDAALLLEAMAGHDPADPASIESAGSMRGTASGGLEGRRIGVLRSYRGAASQPRVNAVYQQAVDRLTELGAELVDPIEFETNPELGAAGYRVLLAEFKAGLAAYLDSHEIPADRANLPGLIEFNQTNAGHVMPDFGQSIFIEASTAPDLTDSGYQADLKLVQADLRRDLDALFAEQRLDALFLPVNGPAWKTDRVNGDSFSFGGTAYLAALTGYPSVVLPGGQIEGLPVGVGFTGLRLTEVKLIDMARALEQALPTAPLPAFIPTLESP